MFKWLGKCIKDANDIDELTKKVEPVKEPEKPKDINNYTTKENGDIEIKVERESTIGWFYSYKTDFVIPKSDIVSHTENSIVFKDYRIYFNFESNYFNYVAYKSIENKDNLIKYKETQIKTYEYFNEYKCWKHTKTDIVGTEKMSERTPIEIFKKEFKSKYCLIETEDELNEYLSSTLDCNTWCRMKLYNKMKELGLGDGFINSFADLIGNDLDKYHAMIDLANEVSDKDTLMYLYTYKFGNNNKNGYNMLCSNGTVTTTYSAN